MLSPHEIIIRQIETANRLDGGDRDALRGLPLRLRTISGNRDIFREGHRPTECCAILSGVGCRYKIVGGGRRQIVSFHFPGDMPDSQSLFLEKMDHNLGTITPAKVALIPHAAIIAVMDQRRSLATVFARQGQIEGSIFREWVANIGRRSALARVAHLICECFERMHTIGLADNATFELPITHAELGDATGLSNVHINRTMRTLRGDNLVKTVGKVHTICDWTRLRELADYRPDYLHLLGKDIET
jgi:CRP-like cAMP-binding protein